jgi:hypothetical protein
MSSCRMAAAVFALVFVIGQASAQVTDPLEPPTKPAVPAEGASTPAQAESQVSPPPVQVSAVPEPGSILLLAGPAAVGWVAYWRRKWRAEPNSNGPTTQP